MSEPAPVTEPTTPTEPVTEPPKEPSLVNDTGPVAFDAEKLEFPEGFTKDDTFKKFAEVATEHKLSQPAAQALLSMHHETVKAIYDAWGQTQTEWKGEVERDTEIGGQHLPEVKQTISKLLDNPQLSDPKMREALDMTGAGNNPAIIRTLFRWAKALSEGSSVDGGPAGRDRQGNLNNRPTVADAMYPGGPHTGGPRLS